MRIGVSGASGKLGRALVAELARQRAGHHIVGVTRTPDTIIAGVEGRLGDFDRPETLAAAFAGLDRLVIIPTSALAPGERARQNVAAIDAAVAAGVGHIVFVSGAGTRAVPEPDIGASYYVAEQQLMRKAPTWSILRMNYYAESLVDEAKMSLGRGVLTGLAESRVAFVSRDDVAAAAVGVVLGERHAGAIYNATGPASLTGADRAAAIAKAAGVPFGFVIVTRETLRQSLAQAQLPTDVVNAIVSIQEAFAAGGFDIVTGDVQRLAGRRPRSLDDILHEALAPARSAG
jgi:NAD(P)H dehydrogenase (quinone)